MTVRFFVTVCFMFCCVSAGATEPLIIDTDMCPDDIMAINYLLPQKQFNTVAIIVDNNAGTNCRVTMPRLLSLLKHYQGTSVPVACGAAKAIGQGHRYPPAIQQAIEQSIRKALPKQRLKGLRKDGVQLLIKTVKNSRQPVTLLCIGSLTNLALALQKDPAIKKNIHRVVIMGGALNVPGNVQEIEKYSHNKTAEWNFYFDPEAARQVFAANLPIELVPLDATVKAPMTMAFYHQAVAYYQKTNPMMVSLMQQLKSGIAQKELFFWDQLAATIVVDSKGCGCHTQGVRILTSPSHLAGSVVKDKTAPAVRVYDCHDWHSSVLLQ